MSLYSHTSIVGTTAGVEMRVVTVVVGVTVKVSVAEIITVSPVDTEIQEADEFKDGVKNCEQRTD